MVFREYPKLLFLCAVSVGANALYLAGGLDFLHKVSESQAYIAVFVGGMLFSFGFTSPFGIGVLLEIGHVVHPVLGALLGGLGAVLVDLVIFRAVRFEFFHEEINRIKNTRLLLRIHGILHHEKFPQKLREYLLWSFAGLVIASPLPDEFGVLLVSSFSDIKPRTFALVCFLCNSAGVFMFLLGSRAVA
jgi:hypothetical protein